MKTKTWINMLLSRFTGNMKKWVSIIAERFGLSPSNSIRLKH